MTPTSEDRRLKKYIHYNKLKLYPTPTVGWHRKKIYYLRVLPGCKIFFLKDGNRPCCEDWDYTDNVDIERGNEPHATENPQICIHGINFPGRYEILFADNSAISETGAAKNRILKPKRGTEPKV